MQEQEDALAELEQAGANTAEVSAAAAELQARRAQRLEAQQARLKQREAAAAALEQAGASAAEARPPTRRLWQAPEGCVVCGGARPAAARSRHLDERRRDEDRGAQSDVAARRADEDFEDARHLPCEPQWRWSRLNSR